MPLCTADRRCPDAVFVPDDNTAQEAASEEQMAVLRGSTRAVVEVMGAGTVGGARGCRVSGQHVDWQPVTPRGGKGLPTKAELVRRSSDQETSPRWPMTAGDDRARGRRFWSRLAWVYFVDDERGTKESNVLSTGEII
jgi:hypothetical protein